MQSMILVFLSLWMLAGCVKTFPDVVTPGHRTLSLAQYREHLYVRSERALVALGAVPSLHDLDAGILVATLPGETAPLRIVARRDVIGNQLTVDGPESAITRFLDAF